MPAESRFCWRRAIPAGSLICVMDERGVVETSPEFANRLGGWRGNQGRGDLCFGHWRGRWHRQGARREARSRLVILARLVWPHMMVRVNVEEAAV